MEVEVEDGRGREARREGGGRRVARGEGREGLAVVAVCLREQGDWSSGWVGTKVAKAVTSMTATRDRGASNGGGSVGREWRGREGEGTGAGGEKEGPVAMGTSSSMEISSSTVRPVDVDWGSNRGAGEMGGSNTERAHQCCRQGG
eukprot:scaffold6045_cov167-Amphora_coffeaeformis.AAC.1